MVDLPYRPCVGIVLVNKASQVFTGQRLDHMSAAWQMPQGGIDAGELPDEAAMRELLEETGTNKVKIIQESKDWHHYDLPEDLIPQLWGGKYRGQKQKWFKMAFLGNDDDINTQTEHPEFADWRWSDPVEVPKMIVSFKRALYEQVMDEFFP